MAHTMPGFAPGPGDELTMRTLPVFFGVLELLLTAGVTTVAEAAFQNRVWRPHLTPLLPIARVRIVHCVVDAEVAVERALRRGARAAHADLRPADQLRRHRDFDRVSLDVPWIAVDTRSDYRPNMDQIITFISNS